MCRHLKNTGKKKLLVWFMVLDLAIMVYLSFTQSDPLHMAKAASDWNSYSDNGVFFITGVILGPLILGGYIR